MKHLKAPFYLAISGFTLLLVGAYIGFTPDDYLRKFEITRYQQDLTSELRGMGGNLFIFGLFILASLQKHHLRQSALQICVLLFSAFAAFRLIDIALEGLPSSAILMALGIEALLAILGGILLLTPHTKKEPQKKATK